MICSILELEQEILVLQFMSKLQKVPFEITSQRQTITKMALFHKQMAITTEGICNIDHVGTQERHLGTKYRYRV